MVALRPQGPQPTSNSTISLTRSISLSFTAVNCMSQDPEKLQMFTVTETEFWAEGSSRRTSRNLPRSRSASIGIPMPSAF